MSTNEVANNQEEQDEGKYLTPEICNDLINATAELCSDANENLGFLSEVFISICNASGYEPYFNLYSRSFSVSLNTPKISGYQIHDNPKNKGQLAGDLEEALTEVLSSVSLSNHYQNCGCSSDTPVICTEHIDDLSYKLSLVMDYFSAYFSSSNISLQIPESNNFISPLSQGITALSSDIDCILHDIMDEISVIKYNIDNVASLLSSTPNTGSVLRSSNVRWDKIDF